MKDAGSSAPFPAAKEGILRPHLGDPAFPSRPVAFPARPGRAPPSPKMAPRFDAPRLALFQDGHPAPCPLLRWPPRTTDWRAARGRGERPHPDRLRAPPTGRGSGAVVDNMAAAGASAGGRGGGRGGGGRGKAPHS